MFWDKFLKTKKVIVLEQWSKTIQFMRRIISIERDTDVYNAGHRNHVKAWMDYFSAWKKNCHPKFCLTKSDKFIWKYSGGNFFTLNCLLLFLFFFQLKTNKHNEEWTKNNILVAAKVWGVQKWHNQGKEYPISYCFTLFNIFKIIIEHDIFFQMS